MPVAVYLSDNVPPLVFPRRFRNYLRRAMAVTGFEPPDALVNFILLDEPAMAELNGLHLHHAGSTDVITYDLRPAAEGAPAGPRVLLLPQLRFARAGVRGEDEM